MITSRQNPQIKEALTLQDRRARDESGLFLIEGFREVTRAVKGGVVLQKLFVCPALFLGENEKALIEQIESTGTDPLFCSEEVFRKLSYRDRPDGLIAVAVQMHFELGSLKVKDSPFFIVAEGIEKPGNLGSILRSADGAGAHGVIVCDRCTDIYNPNVVRASVGTLFTQPVVEATGPDAYNFLKRHKIQVVAATPSAKTLYTEASLAGAVALVVGTEQLGLTELWMHAADIQVAIPMRGVADSLNVATAATLLMYEVVRQRNHLLR